MRQLAPVTVSSPLQENLSEKSAVNRSRIVSLFRRPVLCSFLGALLRACAPETSSPPPRSPNRSPYSCAARRFCRLDRPRS
jgi:hypothetical protein